LIRWPYWKTCRSDICGAEKSGLWLRRLAPDVFEVEFCDHTGHTYAMFTLRAEQLIHPSQSAEQQLTAFEEMWATTYPVIAKS